MSEPGLVETADPETAFKALSDATRVDILLALWDTEDRTAAFSALRERVGMADSGQFNYHLDKLTDRFVRQTDEGYTLTLAGKQIAGAIQAGAYTMAGSIEPIALDEPCPTCGGARTFNYEDETVRIECDSCPVVATAGVPPGVFAGYERAAFPDVANRYFLTIFQQVENGFCWYCDGQVETTVQPVSETIDDDALVEEFADRPMVQYTCKRCGAEISGDPGVILQFHPVVAGFFFDHGIDVRDRPFWEASSLNDAPAAFRGREPVRATQTFATDDATLTVVFDEELTVLDVEREPA